LVGATAPDGPALAEEDAVAGDIVGQGEPEPLATDGIGKCAALAVVQGQHRVVGGPLVAEDIPLKLAVLLPGEAVQVIGGDVEDAGHMGAALQKLELGMADLQDDPGIRSDLLQVLKEGDADITGYEMGYSFGAEHLAQEGGGRRLAAGAGDAHHGARAKLQEKLEHRGDGDAAAARLHQPRQVQGHALGDEDGIGLHYSGGIVGAQGEAQGEVGHLLEALL
jgi:hypothetical protein